MVSLKTVFCVILRWVLQFDYEERQCVNFEGNGIVWDGEKIVIICLFDLKKKES